MCNPNESNSILRYLSIFFPFFYFRISITSIMNAGTAIIRQNTSNIFSEPPCFLLYNHVILEYPWGYLSDTHLAWVYLILWWGYPLFLLCNLVITFLFILSLVSNTAYSTLYRRQNQLDTPCLSCEPCHNRACNRPDSPILGKSCIR